MEQKIDEISEKLTNIETSIKKLFDLKRVTDRITDKQRNTNQKIDELIKQIDKLGLVKQIIDMCKFLTILFCLYGIIDLIWS